jgi:hypothetical protein
MRRRAIGLLAAGLVMVGAVGIAPSSASAVSCGIRWGSLPRSGSAATAGVVVGVRAGEHACFDRLVVDIGRAGTGWSVRYVAAVHTQASGRVVPLRGGAFLEVVVASPTYDPSTGRPTYQPANTSELVGVSGWRTFRQVASGGSFEGRSTFGLGVRARLPFRAFLLGGPGDGARLVIDVAHRW